ncbi:hypothetical protein HRW18_05505 [Streptomyces lunaelactis]|uniref:hypothetical protein n=1 Tax=Streptomyces lunaelactis TaxID=1535768 RepID=UPI0015851141|nr:hypothetical protein [Streptomyces lunaelactis]NUK07479.1 hypothetical protein [Streptomyces lunaelactis]
MNVGLTLTGLAIALAIGYANLRPWWKGGRDGKQLVPFGSGFGLGALATICTGGMLGWLAGCSVQIANRGGEKAIDATTGSANTAALARGDLGDLTPEGGIVVFLIAIGVLLAWRTAGKQDKKRMVGGAFVGCTLCVTAGVAGLLAWLPGLVNTLGMQLRTIVEGASVL